MPIAMPNTAAIMPPISSATGNDYVVNYMSGECYRAVQQEDGTWKLYTIEAKEEESSAEGF